MVLIILRSADELRPAEFPIDAGELDDEAVAIAMTIIKWRSGSFDPSTFRDRYQEALRELAEAKIRGKKAVAKPAHAPPPVVDLMAALKESLVREAHGPATKPRRKAAPDRRQRNLLLRQLCP